jgi:hypothetical protein
MDTEFSSLEVFDLYLHDDNDRAHLVFSSAVFADVQDAARTYGKSMTRHFPYWRIRLSIGDPDPILDQMIAESYRPMTEVMQADLKSREEVFV